MTSPAINPELREAIRAHAQRLAASAPPPTDEQLVTLRRWFGPKTRRSIRRDAA